MRKEFWADTEKAAMLGLKGLLPLAKKDAEDQQAKALKAARANPGALCKRGKPPCLKCLGRAWPIKPVALWTAVGSAAPYKKWLARGGYEWSILVQCACPDKKKK
jgi:hypothetical protein